MSIQNNDNLIQNIIFLKIPDITSVFDNHHSFESTGHSWDKKSHTVHGYLWVSYEKITLIYSEKYIIWTRSYTDKTFSQFYHLSDEILRYILVV